MQSRSSRMIRDGAVSNASVMKLDNACRMDVAFSTASLEQDTKTLQTKAQDIKQEFGPDKPQIHQD